MVLFHNNYYYINEFFRGEGYVCSVGKNSSLQSVKFYCLCIFACWEGFVSSAEYNKITMFKKVINYYYYFYL